MSTPLRPSTPVARTATSSTPAGGSWRHPQLEEISRRQKAASFTDRNVKNAAYNVAGLIVIWYIGRTLWSGFPNLLHDGGAFHPYAGYIYYGLQLTLTYNILVAFWPLLRAPDDLSDIPLTPAQRKLLGLPPTSKPPTPGSQYSTPPRVARTPTPSGSPANKIGNFSNSPSGSPKSGSIAGSPFSPGQSPFLQKAMGGTGFDGSRRHSYGSPSPLGPAGSRATVTVPETPSTPTPLAGKGASVGLNNRWLYEKGRRNSGNARIFAS